MASLSLSTTAFSANTSEVQVVSKLAMAHARVELTPLMRTVMVNRPPTPGAPSGMLHVRSVRVPVVPARAIWACTRASEVETT